MRQGKVEQYKDRAWLHRKYYVNKLSLEKVGELCGVSHNCIWEWLKKNGIERRSHSEHLKGKPAWNSDLTSNVDKRILAGNTHGMWGKIQPEKSRKIARMKAKIWYMKNPTFHKGKNNPFYGRKHSEESLQKNRKANSMENHYNWQGGLSFGSYGTEFNKGLKLFVRQRDDFICQLCGVMENGREHDCHHVDYNKKNNNEINLILLCKSCNSKANRDRERWEFLYQTLQEIRGTRSVDND